MLKRVLSLILAMVLCLGILAGCDQTPAETTAPPETTKPVETTAPPETTVPEETEPEKLYFDETLIIEMYRPANQSAAPQYVIDLVKEMLNVEIKMTELDSFEEQYGLMVSDNKIPALTWVNGDFFGNQYGPDGAYVNVMEYLDQMPNLKAALEKYPEYYDRWIQENGEMYHIPCMSVGGSTTTYGYFYREDIFAKHNLTWPTTREGLEEVMRELKKLYPDSYPMAIRNLGGTHISAVVDWGVAFGAKLQYPGRNDAYATLNNETGKWYEGATSAELKEMITWIKEMMDEDLIHPSGATMTAADWNAYLNSGTSFISWDKMDRLPGINAEGVKTDENFSMVGAEPIKMADAGQAAYLAPGGASPYSFLVSANADRLEDILAYIDWLYSEEGVMATNYGKAGDTYTLDADGSPVWRDACKAEAQPQTARGLVVGGHYGIFEFQSYISWQGDGMQRTYATSGANATVTDYYPALSYNEEEQRIADTYGEAYNTYTKGELIKFMLGERDLAEWDAYAQEAATTYHGTELVAIAQSAWDRANAG